jgi:predicted lactoylglutathione lyase
MAAKKKASSARAKKPVAPARPKRAPSRAPRPGPVLTVLTLGVQDLGRSRAFYEAVGFRASRASNESIVFLHAGAVVISLYRRKLLADDANVSAAGSGFAGVTFARNVGSRQQVDAAIDEARKAGARIHKPAQDAFWGGYSGYFADPDGHLWEVAHNPHWKLDAAGRVVLPE